MIKENEMALGDINVEIRPATKEHPKHVVLVKELKFDTIRQAEYWVTTNVREYRLKADAETFAARFEKK